MLKIGIDISQVIYETGVSWYTFKLVENLLKIDKENDYVLFGGTLRQVKSLKFKVKSLKGNFESKFYLIPPTIADLIWNKLQILPIEIFTGNLDVFHSSDWTQPPSKAFKVTTIHDLSPIKFQEATNPKIVHVHKRRLEWVKKEVERIIVPSQATFNDAVEFGLKKELITVIPEASTFDTPSSKIEILAIKRKYNIKRPYLLTIGVNDRKNTIRIIQAYKDSKFFEHYDLVVVGEPQIEIEKFQGLIPVGHVSQEELRDFLSGTEVLVFPSLYEGFGLPILDAFACRCPVVTSNISSMPEVAGNAAVLVDPYDVDSIASGITESLNKSQIYIKKGFARVKNFSWEKTANMTLDVYKES